MLSFDIQFEGILTKYSSAQQILTMKIDFLIISSLYLLKMKIVIIGIPNVPMTYAIEETDITYERNEPETPMVSRPRVSP